MIYDELAAEAAVDPLDRGRGPDAEAPADSARVFLRADGPYRRIHPDELDQREA